MFLYNIRKYFSKTFIKNTFQTESQHTFNNVSLRSIFSGNISFKNSFMRITVISKGEYDIEKHFSVINSISNFSVFKSIFKILLNV